MDKKNLVEIIDSELKPLGFKRKGIIWRAESYELIKEVDLQKSNFSNLYYLNFGFIIKGLELSHFKRHVYESLYGRTPQESLFIKNFLDLENLEEKHVELFKEIFNDKISSVFKTINSCDKLKIYVLDHIDKIPLIPIELKNFYNIE